MVGHEALLGCHTAGKARLLANPAKGSRHNRGCAVDLTLYTLADRRAVEMPSTYDEMTERASPRYGGGTAAQRARRDLLRRAMEAQGFKVFASEWWHFDHHLWREYPILNLPFESLGGSGHRSSNDRRGTLPPADPPTSPSAP